MWFLSAFKERKKKRGNIIDETAVARLKFL
jgi:hypothetical protein